jgi:hypothetical protein
MYGSSWRNLRPAGSELDEAAMLIAIKSFCLTSAFFKELGFD